MEIVIPFDCWPESQLFLNINDWLEENYVGQYELVYHEKLDSVTIIVDSVIGVELKLKWLN